MKTILLLFISMLFCKTVFAQNINRLWIEFKTGNAAQRVKACDELTRYYRSEAHDSLRVLGEELFLYGIDQHYYPAIERGKLTLATYFILIGKTAEGITIAKALLSNMEERGDDHMIVLTAGTISLGYVTQKDGKSANYWAKKATKTGETNADPLVRSEALMALAESYYMLNQMDKAVETYRKYITLIKPYNKYRSISAAYARLGDMHRLAGNMELATRFFKYSMENAQKSGRTIALAHAINNMGIVYFEQGDTARSRASFEKAMALRLKINDAKSISESYYNMGDYHFYTSNYEAAISWYKKSLEFARTNNLKPEQADALRALAEFSKGTEDFKGATTYLEHYLLLKDQIALENSTDDEEIADLQRTIMRLETENEIANGKFGTEQQTNLKWEWLVIAFLGTILLLSFFVRKRSS